MTALSIYLFRCLPILTLSKGLLKVNSTLVLHIHVLNQHHMVLEEFKAVEEGVSIRVAVDKYSVPRLSLRNRVSGKVGFQSRPGPSPYLSFEEEEELTSFLVQVATLGYPHTRKQVLSLVERILTSKGLQVSVSSECFERFHQRHPY